MASERRLTPNSTRVEGGVASDLPPRLRLPLLVAPTTTDRYNTVRPEILPVACCRLDDVRFGFGSSFLLPQSAEELARLLLLLTAREGAVLSVFGHADATGGEELNKALSGRRAAVVFGLLVRDASIWEDLFTHPSGSDDWSLSAVRIMLDALGFPPGSFDATPDPVTDSAVLAFQTSAGLPPTGQADSATRARLFSAYMDAICVDGSGRPFKLGKDQFLGGGADSGGKADHQGCGEQNPVLVFSAADLARFAAAADKLERDRESAPNRRVVIYLFRPGTRVDPSSWPCPRSSEGPSDCHRRLWSDAPARRASGAHRRESKSTGDTFACRFYDRLARLSPCEDVPSPAIPPELVAGRLPSLCSTGRTFPKPSSIPMLREVVRRMTEDRQIRALIFGHTDMTGPDGVNLQLSRARAAAVRAFLVGDEAYFRARFEEPDPLARWDWEEIQWMLSALDVDGDPFYAGFIDGHCSDRTLAALQSFQLANDIDASHQCDETTLRALIQRYLGVLGEARPRPEQIEIAGGGAWHPPRTFGKDSVVSTDLLCGADDLPGYRRVELFLGHGAFFPSASACAPRRHTDCTTYEAWCRAVSEELGSEPRHTMLLRIVDPGGRALANLGVHLYAYLDDEGETLIASMTTTRYGALRLTAPPGFYAVSFFVSGEEQRAAFYVHTDEVGGITIRVDDAEDSSALVEPAT